MKSSEVAIRNHEKCQHNNNKSRIVTRNFWLLFPSCWSVRFRLKFKSNWLIEQIFFELFSIIIYGNDNLNFSLTESSSSLVFISLVHHHPLQRSSDRIRSGSEREPFLCLCVWTSHFIFCIIFLVNSPVLRFEIIEMIKNLATKSISRLV